MRTFFAIIACFLLVIIWNIFCTSMGWRFQGGAIPASIFYTGLLFVWQAIRGTGLFKKKSAIQPDDGSTSSGLSLIILPAVVFVIYGLSQMYAGFIGIETYAGTVWACAALGVALFARFTLPLTVGCFYAAEHVWGWHWSLALLFAAPGVVFNLLMLPGLAAKAFGRFSGKSNSDAPESETTTPDWCEPESIPLILAAAPTELSGYELLAAEKKNGYRHEALWLKCHSEADGDETKAESAYNRGRAAMLAKESLAKVAMEKGSPTAELKSKPLKGTRSIQVALVVLSFGAALLCAVVSVWWVEFKEQKQVTPMLAQSATAESAQFTTYTNTIGMQFAVVPDANVLFCIHETRNADYAAYAAENSEIAPEWKKETGSGRDQYPVANVSWSESQAFCQWLSRKEGKTYRLPTDYEWSLAVGIGNQEVEQDSPEKKDMKILGVYPWGTSFPPDVMNGNYDLVGVVDGYDRTAPVGSFKANAFGIYDLGGNVSEWCDDWYNKTNRTIRGSSWRSDEEPRLLSSYRNLDTVFARSDYTGFRVVLETGSKPAVSNETVSKPAVSNETVSKPAVSNETVSKPAVAMETAEDADARKLTMAKEAEAKLLTANEEAEWAKSREYINSISEVTGIDFELFNVSSSGRVEKHNLAKKVGEIIDERIATSQAKGLGIRNADIYAALVRSRYLELNQNRGNDEMNYSERKVLQQCRDKSVGDAILIRKISEWVSNESSAQRLRQSYYNILSQNSMVPPYSSDVPPTEAKLINSWIGHNKTELLYFWGVPISMGPNPQDPNGSGELIIYPATLPSSFSTANDGSKTQLVVQFETGNDGVIFYWRAGKIPAK